MLNTLSKTAREIGNCMRQIKPKYHFKVFVKNCSDFDSLVFQTCYTLRRRIVVLSAVFYCVQEICYRIKRYDVRGTMHRVQKGCWLVTNCTTDMYTASNGICYGQTCITCIDRPSSCSGYAGNLHCISEVSYRKRTQYERTF